MQLDHSVYPDLDSPPESLQTPHDKADYLHRICAAWDFGIHPDASTFQLLSEWKDVFDQFPVLTSPAYHTLRRWFGWNDLPYPPGILPPVPRWVHLDRLEGRGSDPCENMV